MVMLSEQLAKEFSDGLKRILSSTEIAEVVRRNRVETSPNICHSHDFCDANMVLHEVFMNHRMDIADEGGRERWGSIWDTSWNLAKSKDFWVPK